MATKNSMWEKGYRDAYEGKNAVESNADYDEGFDTGTCDRPTLDEMLGVDVAKERFDPLGF